MKISKYNVIDTFGNKGNTCNIVFNAQTQKILEIPTSVCKALEERDVPSIAHKHYATLIYNGILVPDTSNETDKIIQQVRANRSHEELRLVLIPTYACNLQCPYCYAREVVSKVKNCNSSWSQDIISFLKLYIPKLKRKVVTISFFGGEPLLKARECLEIAKASRAIVEKVKGNLLCTITTNGTILTDTSLELLEYVDSLQITLDGIGDEHDNYRQFKNKTGTYEKILEFIREAGKRQIRQAVRFHLHTYSDDYLHRCARELWKKLKNFESTSIYFADVKWGFYKKSGQCSNHGVELQANFDRLHNARKIFLSEGWNPERVYLHSEGNKEHVVSITCGFIGKESFLIDGNKDIYCCPVAFGNKDMLLGRIHKDNCEFYPLRNALVDNWNPPKNCLNCCLLPLCEGGCVAKARINHGKIEKSYCEKEQIEALIRRKCGHYVRKL